MDGESSIESGRDQEPIVTVVIESSQNRSRKLYNDFRLREIVLDVKNFWIDRAKQEIDTEDIVIMTVKREVLSEATSLRSICESEKNFDIIKLLVEWTSGIRFSIFKSSRKASSLLCGLRETPNKIKSRLREKFHIAKKKPFRLLFQGRTLPDDECLKTFGVNENSEMQIDMAIIAVICDEWEDTDVHHREYFASDKGEDLIQTGDEYRHLFVNNVEVHPGQHIVDVLPEVNNCECLEVNLTLHADRQVWLKFGQCLEERYVWANQTLADILPGRHRDSEVISNGELVEHAMPFSDMKPSTGQLFVVDPLRLIVNSLMRCVRVRVDRDSLLHDLTMKVGATIKYDSYELWVGKTYLNDQAASLSRLPIQNDDIISVKINTLQIKILTDCSPVEFTGYCKQVSIRELIKFIKQLGNVSAETNLGCLKLICVNCKKLFNAARHRDLTFPSNCCAEKGKTLRLQETVILSFSFNNATTFINGGQKIRKLTLELPKDPTVLDLKKALCHHYGCDQSLFSIKGRKAIGPYGQEVQEVMSDRESTASADEKGRVMFWSEKNPKPRSEIYESTDRILNIKKSVIFLQLCPLVK